MGMESSSERFTDRIEREPILTLRRILWILLGGWVLFLCYSFVALLLCLTLILIPWGVEALRFALFALCPIGYTFEPLQLRAHHRWNPLRNYPPKHPVSVAANVMWLLTVGWAILLAHVAVLLLQVVSIVGIPNAIHHARLIQFAAWPFGLEIVNTKPRQQISTKFVVGNNFPIHFFCDSLQPYALHQAVLNLEKVGLSPPPPAAEAEAEEHVLETIKVVA